MTTSPPPSLAVLQRVFADIDRIREKGPSQPEPRQLSLEERVEKLEAEHRRLAGEVLVAQPAMIEAVALVLASTLGSAPDVAMLRENAAAMLNQKNGGESEWHRDHIAIGRNMAAAAVLRMAEVLESAVAGAATFAPSSDEVH